MPPKTEEIKGSEGLGPASAVPNSHLLAALEAVAGSRPNSARDQSDVDDKQPEPVKTEIEDVEKRERAVLLGDSSAAQPDKSEMSKMQLMELKIVEACQEIAGIVLAELDRFKLRSLLLDWDRKWSKMTFGERHGNLKDKNEYGPDMEKAMTLADEKSQVDFAIGLRAECDPRFSHRDHCFQVKRKDLEEEMKSMHESIHRMFSQQLEDSL
eukprot:403782-Rhodomonas_salina.1